ncbi:MAG: hypothetical protein JWR83_2703 [Aeromicrobium sp.]|nr:hypothetical protein [Aeromicrobium sp.]
MHVVVGGASGFLGSALTQHLRSSGHQVTLLVRAGGTGDDASPWDPANGLVDQSVIDNADAVVNLSGSSISRWPRTKARKRELLQSRVCATNTLAKAVAAAPKPPALISGSAMAWYGADRGDELLPESSSPGHGFLADVCHAWEGAAQPAVDAGARVCFVRTSLVLDASHGILALMLPAWKLGGGAKLGNGKQYMSLISLNDWLRGVAFLIETPEASGPFNLAMPGASTNAEFTEALGRAVHRPTFLAAPKFVLKTALGGAADDLLGSLHLSPAALLDAGFSFEQPDLTSVLAVAVR